MSYESIKAPSMNQYVCKGLILRIPVRVPLLDFMLRISRATVSTPPPSIRDKLEVGSRVSRETNSKNT